MVSTSLNRSAMNKAERRTALDFGQTLQRIMDRKRISAQTLGGLSSYGTDCVERLVAGGRLLTPTILDSLLQVLGNDFETRYDLSVAAGYLPSQPSVMLAESVKRAIREEELRQRLT